MDESFITCLKTNADVKQCEGCHMTYEDTKKITEGLAFQFLFTHGVLLKEVICKLCSNIVKLKTTSKLVPNYSGTKGDDLKYTCFKYRCSRTVRLKKQKPKVCNFRQSIFVDTYIQRSNLKLKEIFQLTCAMLTISPPRHNFIVNDVGLTSSSVIEWYLRTREVLIVSVSENIEKLGGEGHYVELYEALTDEAENLPWSWAFGAIDSSSHHTFLIPVEHHNFTSIKDLILEKIHPGTTVVASCLTMKCIKELERLFIDLKIKFVMINKCHLAEDIRLRWCEVLKTNSNTFKNRVRYKVDHLAEYLFKAKYSNPSTRLHAFFQAAGKLYR